VIQKLFALAGLLGGVLPSAMQESRPPSEHQVKAALILNIAKFVEWPAGKFKDAEAPLVLGVLGKDPFGDLLEKTFKDQKVAGRTFLIQRAALIQDLGSCHLVFVSESERDRRGPILEALGKLKALTIGEGDGFAEAGGVLGFIRENKRIHFEINTAAAERSELKISSKLLKLARIVKEDR
jgi:hypothetical protein